VPDIHAAASAVIPAPPPVVDRILADYREGHPSILVYAAELALLADRAAGAR